MVAAAPWVALAAAIIYWENKQSKEGNRGSDWKEQMGDIATGKVLERDLEKYSGKGAAKFGRMTTPSGIVRQFKEWF